MEKYQPSVPKIASTEDICYKKEGKFIDDFLLEIFFYSDVFTTISVPIRSVPY